MKGDNLEMFTGLATWDLFNGQSATSRIHPHQIFTEDHLQNVFLGYFLGWKAWMKG